MSDEDLRFAETHEWARQEDEAIVVGLSAFALEQLGDVVYLELPDEGDDLPQGASFGVVESVKAASDMYAPVSGVVVEVNADLSENLDVLKNDPYGDGWIIKMEPSDLAEFDALMNAEEYEEFCEGETEDDDADDVDLDYELDDEEE